MFKTKNNFNGATFEHESEGCSASGEFRFEDSNLSSVNISGTYTKADKQYNFWASRDAKGNINLNGAPSEVIVEVATEIKAIIEEIENLNTED